MVARSVLAIGPIAHQAARLASSATLAEIDVFLYSGWNFPDGRLTRLGTVMSREVRRHRRRMNGVAVRPDLRFSTLCLGGQQLRGLFRPNPPPPRQKLVDTMLALDAVYIARRTARELWIASDDDDLVPAVAEASLASRTRVILLRDAPSPNDAVLRRCSVTRGSSLGTLLNAKGTP
jgi:hypothetical protein